MPLEPEEQTHINAARGYIELGMFLDANVELERMDSDAVKPIVTRHAVRIVGNN